MELASAKEKLRRAEEKVRRYLARYDVRLSPAQIAIEPALEQGTVATHRHPATVVVREASVPESVISHELIHIAQGTLEQFRGFQLLYVLLSEGLADWVAKELYLQHEVKYLTGYRLVELLVRADERSIHDLFRLNDVPLTPDDLDGILVYPRLPDYSRNLLTRMSDSIRDSVRTASEESITDPTFITLGEEIRAWKFLLSERFEAISAEVGRLLGEYFGKPA